MKNYWTFHSILIISFLTVCFKKKDVGITTTGSNLIDFEIVKYSRAWPKNPYFAIRLSLFLILVISTINSKPKINFVATNSTLSKSEGIQEIQLTHDPKGHFLNQRQAFSPDDRFLVFDNRNDDSKIGENASIQLINIETKEVQTLYNLDNQTIFGPGVGAVSFHPKKNKVVFIHGLMNASESNPYGITSRFAMEVNLDSANDSRPLEARDVKSPFTKGALRGGSHAYSYSSDGQLISFTYNDAILEQESKVNPNVHDLRTVGAFLLDEPVSIIGVTNEENFNGTAFAILLAEVTAKPLPGSDQISKAYEECWVGSNGYEKPNGTIQKRALAFLGDVISESGERITELFISDIPQDLSLVKSKISAGTRTSLPSIPEGVQTRRLTFTSSEINPGVQGPRQWLRSSPDGEEIYFYKKDDQGIVQIFSVSPNGGKIKPITKNDFSAETSFALSHDGKYLVYGSMEKIFVTSLSDGKTTLVSPSQSISTIGLSNINWANNAYTIAYNRKVDLGGEAFYQLFTLDLSGFLK